MAEQKYLDLDGLKLVLSKLKEHGYQGYGLSQEDFTTELKNKYDALVAASSVEDLTELFKRVNAVEKLIESDTDGAINKFNEIVAFLNGISDTKTLNGMFGDISAQIEAAKPVALTNAEIEAALNGTAE